VDGSVDGGVHGVDGGGVVWAGVDGDVSGGVGGGGVLLLAVVLVHLVGGSGRLAVHEGVDGAVRLVHGGVHGGRVAVLHRLMASLVGGHGRGEEGHHEELER